MAAGPDDDAPVPAIDIETRHGPARVHVHRVAEPVGLLVLGHGAGGGVTAPDLVAATRAATELGVLTALVEQPYRVAGRRAPPRAPTLDAAWSDVVAHLPDHLRDHLGDLPLITGGRSSGARVACRTAQATGAAGVLCLAFPVRPPGRPDRPDRLGELDAVSVPALVVQGDRDPYGMPPQGPQRQVVAVAGDHSLRRDLPAVRAAVGPWLAAVLQS